MVPAALEECSQAAAGLFGAFGIPAVDYSEEVNHCFVRRSDGLFAIGPCGDGLANHFRGGKTLAASQTRDALTRFGVEAECEWRCHDGLLDGVSVTRFVIQRKGFE
jgi:hypothetical protein